MNTGKLPTNPDWNLEQHRFIYLYSFYCHSISYPVHLNLSTGIYYLFPNTRRQLARKIAPDIAEL